MKIFALATAGAAKAAEKRATAPRVRCCIRHRHRAGSANTPYAAEHTAAVGGKTPALPRLALAHRKLAWQNAGPYRKAALAKANGKSGKAAVAHLKQKSEP
ncbi:hypothetical protein NPIL_317491 [Nephila pilipes]|uniref:Uncharacterized protein n=1 Tax=Nephila pilipes TaxID=299642 RepID=A0A8X6K3V9_NEPPI|nr:hypothetical protein NPIL_317491 [Nephila pilipes]